MRFSFQQNALVFPVLLCMVALSCKKDSTSSSPGNTSQTKRTWISGTWKQKDLVLGYPVDLGGGNQLPVGFSVYNITSMLPVSGPLIDCTKDNTYTFNADSTYAITGCTELELPNAGMAGKWRMEIYDAVLRMTSTENKTAPYWTNSLSETEWNLGITIHIDEFGADLPVNLILEKQ